MLKVKKLAANATPPLKAPGSAAYDLFANERVTILPEERGIIGTGIAVAFNRKYVGRICDRSGRAWNQGLHVMAGVIDPNYRGEWKVVLYNTGEQSIVIWPGDRIAQVLFYEVANWEVLEVEELNETERGTGGFGSTGG